MMECIVVASEQLSECRARSEVVSVSEVRSPDGAADGSEVLGGSMAPWDLKPLEPLLKWKQRAAYKSSA